MFKFNNNLILIAIRVNSVVLTHDWKKVEKTCTPYTEDILGVSRSDSLLNFNQWFGNSIPIFTET